MALPDPISLTWADKATLNPRPFEKIGIGANLPLPLRKVGRDQLIERWFHVKLFNYFNLGREDNDEAAWIFTLRL